MVRKNIYFLVNEMWGIFSSSVTTVNCTLVQKFTMNLKKYKCYNTLFILKILGTLALYLLVKDSILCINNDW